MIFNQINQNELFEFLKHYHFIFDIKNFEFNFFQHLLLYGHYTFNKIDLIRFLLHSYYSYRQKLLYNNDNIVFHIEHNTFNISNNINNFSSKNEQIQLHIQKSPIHWEIDFNFTGNNTNNQLNRNINDYYILQFIINHLCKSINLQTDCNNEKIIVFNNICKLKPKYQKMLYQTMEKSYTNIKFIFISNHLNRVENSLISRTMLVRLPLFYQIKNLNYPYKFIKRNYNCSKDDYQICFYINFSKNNKYIYSIAFNNHSNDFDYSKSLIHYLQNYQNQIDKSLVIQYELYTPDKFFNKFNMTIQSFLQCKDMNKQILYYNYLLQYTNSYFMDCHYLFEFFEQWLSSILGGTNKFLLNLFDNKCNKYLIINLISSIEHKSNYSDYNNYLIENFISNILHIFSN